MQVAAAPLSPAEFSDLLDRLGPFEPSPLVAVAVSGGADSMALAWLASYWVRARGGALAALVVDHGLRRESAEEARLTGERLAGLGIAARTLAVADLTRGPALAERARDARYRVLTAACAEVGAVHLMLGHHAGDQAETVAIRRMARSGPAGLAGMAAVVETDQVRLLRPLLTVAPERLRATLSAASVDWVEDPSNTDTSSTRVRVRAELRARPGACWNLSRLARVSAQERMARERACAESLAAFVTFSPHGYALIRTDVLPADALAAVIAAVSGARYRLSPRDLGDLAQRLKPATVGGVQIRRAGRLAPSGWLAVREAGAMRAPVAAEAGAVWDNRFRLRAGVADATVGPLGALAAKLRGRSSLPACVLHSLPAIRRGDRLLSVPTLDRDDAVCLATWYPASPAACAVFAPAFTE